MGRLDDVHRVTVPTGADVPRPRPRPGLRTLAILAGALCVPTPLGEAPRRIVLAPTPKPLHASDGLDEARREIQRERRKVRRVRKHRRGW